MQIAEQWFHRKRVDDDITLIYEPHVHPLIRCNVWHVRGRDRDLLVDTALGLASLKEAARDLIDKPLLACATHTHFDHTGGMHEFDERLVHAAEARHLAEAHGGMKLRTSDFGEKGKKALEDAGYVLDTEELLDAYPHAGFDPGAHALEPAPPTRVLEDGDTVDIGDRAFEVIHIPGHSPGSIGLWEATTGILFSGDAVYDGPLLDNLEDSNIDDYIVTMERLRALPVSVVHGGHDPSFGRDRLIEICDQYLAKWGAA